MIDLKNTEELPRLEFLEARDGRPGAMEFAVRTFNTYRLLLLSAKSPRLASGSTRNFHGGLYTQDPKFRRGFVRSCLSFREYIRKYR